MPRRELITDDRVSRDSNSILNAWFLRLFIVDESDAIKSTHLRVLMEDRLHCVLLRIVELEHWCAFLDQRTNSWNAVTLKTFSDLALYVCVG